MSFVSTHLSFSRSGTSPPAPCQGCIQVKLSKEHVKINFPSHTIGSFHHWVFLILRMFCHKVVPIYSPCCSLPLFCIRTRFGISYCLWLCNACHVWSTKAISQLPWTKSRGCHVTGIQPPLLAWICIWNLTMWLLLLSLPVGKEARHLVAAQTGFLFHLPGFPMDHSQACWLHSLGQCAVCFLCSAFLKKRRLKSSVLSINCF